MPLKKHEKAIQVGTIVEDLPDGGWTETYEKEKRWFDSDGHLHREDGPACMYPDGSEEWYKHGMYHRVGGPAFSNRRYQEWWLNGKRHREDGPADIDYMVYGSASYWYDGQRIECSTNEEFQRIVKLNFLL